MRADLMTERDVWFHERHCHEWDAVTKAQHAAVVETGHAGPKIVTIARGECQHIVIEWNGVVDYALINKATAVVASPSWCEDQERYARWWQATPEERAEW